MRLLACTIACSFALALGMPVTVGAIGNGAIPSAPGPITLSVVPGYGGQYRVTAWTPVRVTAHNRTGNTVRGTISIHDRGPTIRFSGPNFSSVYGTSVILPSGATKQVLLYLPGRDVGAEVDATFTADGLTPVTAAGYATTMNDQALTVGDLATDPLLTGWLRNLKSVLGTVGVVPLTPSTLDSIPEALASFDIVSIDNSQTSRLDRSQLGALETYVRQGGALLLVGGPDWQETLAPLPPPLIPGTLIGSRVVSGLSGLQALINLDATQRIRKPVGARHGTVQRIQQSTPRRTVVSMLTHVKGTVLATQNRVPLAVRESLGQGAIVYLAFDPAVDGIAGLPGMSTVLNDLLIQADPQVVKRISGATGGFGFRRSSGRFSADAIREELANIPGATAPSVLLLILLGILSVLIVGPLNILLMHRLGRRGLLWITVPVLSLFCLGSTQALASHLQGTVTVVNTVGMVNLDGAGTSHAATLYLGLFAPMHGQYHLVWDGPALPQALPAYSGGWGTSPGPDPVRMRLQEGPQTAIDFLDMNTWGTRAAALQTHVTIPGTVSSNLHVAQDGSIVGTVHNGTTLPLFQPAIIAGSAVLRLPPLAAGDSAPIHMRPAATIDVNSQLSLWDQVLGQSSSSDALSSWDGDPWEEPPPATETTLLDRLRNVAERLPEARAATSVGEVEFVGWTEQSLGHLTVNGAVPQRRNLMLLVKPLSVRFPHGPFQIRQGTVGASLVDDHPVPPQDSGGFFSAGVQPMSVGPGGSLTFQFTFPIPHAIHFRQLRLSANPGGISGSGIGSMYDWRSGRWIPVDVELNGVPLAKPDRFVSPTGRVLVRLHATTQSGDLSVADPLQDLQLSGWAQTP